MKKIKNIFIPLLFAMLMSSFFAMTSFAADTVATIGNKSYSSLESAIQKVKSGQTITLQKDVTSSSTISASGKFTLDLNKHTLAFNKASACLSVDSGTVTIKNGTMKNTSTSQLDSKGILKSNTNYLLKIKKGATVKISSGTYSGKIKNAGKLTISKGTFKLSQKLITGQYNKGSFRLSLLENSGTLNIKGGTFSTPGSNIMNNTGTVTISGGTFKNDDGYAEIGMIYNSGKGKMTISDGIFDASNGGNTSILSSSGTSTTQISGGTFISQGYYGTIVSSENAKVTISNGTFQNLCKDKYYQDNTSVIRNNYNSKTLTITGGTFTSYYGVLMADEAKIKVSGGTFKSTNKGILLKVRSSGTITVTGGTFTASKGYSTYNDGTGKISISSNVKISSKYGEYSPS